MTLSHRVVVRTFLVLSGDGVSGTADGVSGGGTAWFFAMASIKAFFCASRAIFVLDHEGQIEKKTYLKFSL